MDYFIGVAIVTIIAIGNIVIFINKINEWWRKPDDTAMEVAASELKSLEKVTSTRVVIKAENGDSSTQGLNVKQIAQNIPKRKILSPNELIVQCFTSDTEEDFDKAFTEYEVSGDIGFQYESVEELMVSIENSGIEPYQDDVLIADENCPLANFVEPSNSKYKEASAELFAMENISEVMNYHEYFTPANKKIDLGENQKANKKVKIDLRYFPTTGNSYTAKSHYWVGNYDNIPSRKSYMHLLKVEAVQISKQYEKMGVKGLYHFTDRSNLHSIKEHNGLFSWSFLTKNGIIIPAAGGDNLSRKLDQEKHLEDFVRLSFHPDHPMKYVVKNEGRVPNPVVLEIDPRVMMWEKTLFSNVNAVANYAQVGSGSQDLQKVRFDIIKQGKWLTENEKHFFQAEVLVKTHIPLEFILNIDEF